MSTTNKSLYLLLAFLVICLGLDYKDIGGIFLLGKMRYAMFFAAYAVVVLLKREITLFPAILCGFMLGSWVYHDYPVYSVLHLGCTYAVVVCAIIFSRLPANTFAKFLIIVGTIEAVQGICQHFGLYLLFRSNEPWFQNMPIGFQGQQTLLGPLLAACLAPALWKKKYIPAALIVLCCVFTYSSMTYASCAVVLVCWTYTWMNKRVYFGLALSAISLLCFFYLAHPAAQLFDFNGRVPVWKHALNFWKVSPIVGSGPGSWSGYYQPKYVGLMAGIRPFRIHSEYLEMLGEYGAVGVLLMVSALVAFVKKFTFSWPPVTCLAIMVNALANFPLHLVAHSIIFLVAWIYTMRDNGELILLKTE